MKIDQEKINKAFKKGFIGLMLFIPKAFGLIWLYKFLFNKLKIYQPKEQLVNWLAFLITFLLILSLIVYTNYLRQDKKILDVKEMNVWGTVIFFAFIMSLVIIPFKIYFRKRRKQQTYENTKNNNQT